MLFYNRKAEKGLAKIAQVAPSVIAIVSSLALSIGLDFVIFGFKTAEELLTLEYWAETGLHLLSMLLFFYVISDIFKNREIKMNEDYLAKRKTISSAINLTGLEDSDTFLEEHYNNKKYERYQSIIRNKMERIREKADKKGWYLDSKEEKKDFKWFFSRWKYQSMRRQYAKLREKLNSPTLREDIKTMYVPDVYRVRRSFLSDGIASNESDRQDPDKPLSKKTFFAAITFEKVLVTILTSFFISSFLFELNENYVVDVAFWVMVGSRLISYLIHFFMGRENGLVFFELLIYETEVKRENLIQKYLLWFKHRHSDVWKSLTNKNKQEEIVKNEANTSKA
jgi:hypothetical protein